MSDPTAAALASKTDPAIVALMLALPPLSYDTDSEFWHPKFVAEYAVKVLAESGWQLVHRPTSAELIRQSFAEHTAEALALIHDHVEAGDE